LLFPGVVGVERVPYQGSTRRERLPANWPALRAEAKRLNPARICHQCGEPGGTTLDHKERGDLICLAPAQHGPGCQCNLDWIHDRQDVKAGRSRINCHGRKTGAEGAAARQRIEREPEPHPAFG
jgi:hypothetical protein